MEKAYYYRDTVDGDGNPFTEKVGPLPADGDWPSNYAARGLFLRPPSETAGQDAEAGAWRGIWSDVLEEGYTLDDARAWLQEALSEPEATDDLPTDDAPAEEVKPNAGRSK